MSAPALDVPSDRVWSPSGAPLPDEISCQVCVIGTGAGGAVVAQELAARGVDVVVLEEGLYFTARDYGADTPMTAIARLYRDGGLTFTVGKPSILMPLGKCVGGTTVINSGTALRMPESAWQLWRDRHGLSGLGWSDVVGLYERVEAVVGVKPSSEDILGENTKVFREGAERLGYAGEVLPRNAPGCKASGRCFIGCPENAKRATHTNFIPRALELGAALYTGCRAEKLLFAGGRVAGVEVSVEPPPGNPRGRRRRLVVRAPRVVVACGAVLSPILLSRSGLGSGLPELGRNLRIHPASRVVGLFDREIRGQFDVPQSYHLTGFYDQGLSIEGIFVPPSILAPAMPGFGAEHLAMMRDYPRLATIGYRIIDRGGGSVRRSVMGLPLIWYDLGPEDTAKLVRCIAISSEVLFAAGARKVWIPVFGRELLTSIDEARALPYQKIQPTDIEISAYHPHGTLRMGAGAASAVTDLQGRVFGVDGLHVADASLFPESPIVNPMMTIMAFASHIGQVMSV